MDQALLERAKDPPLRVGRGILEPAIGHLQGSFALVTQAEPLAHVSDWVTAGATATVMVESLAEEDLKRLESRLQPVDRVVGIGGGMAMDTAKYLAWRRQIPLVLAPSIVSVDASVANTIALRRDGAVAYDGFVVADLIVADLELISKAPARLNRAGVGDLLSIQTGRFDWALGARAGTMDFESEADAEAGRVLDSLYALADEVAAVTDRALEAILRKYVKVNALLLTVGHSGPEEGSEHYFAYLAEALTGKSFVHGELVGLGTVLMAGLQDNDQQKAAAFLDRCRVRWHPEHLGLDNATLEAILRGLPEFVRKRGLPYSVIDESPMGTTEIARLLGTVRGSAMRSDE